MERQMGDNAMHQLLTTLAEQTNIALEEEATRLWEALRTHNHDIMIDSADQGGQKNVKIQALAGNGGFTGKNPRTIQLNPPSGQATPMMSYKEPAMPAIHPSAQESPMMGCRDFAPRSPCPQISPSIGHRTLMATAPNGHSSTHASMAMSRSMQHVPASEASMYHQEVYPFANQFPQQSTTCNFNFGGGQFRSLDLASETSMQPQEVHPYVNQFPQQSTTCNFAGGGQLRSFDQQPRIRISGLSQNGM